MSKHSRAALPALFLLISIAFIIIAAAPAGATTISFSDTQAIGGQIEIYQINDTGTHLLGVYNTTASGVKIADGTPDNVMVVFKPQATDYLKNPEKIPDLLISLLGVYGGYLAILVVIGGGAILIRRR